MLDKALDITNLQPGQGAELLQASMQPEFGGVEVPMDGQFELDVDGGATVRLGSELAAPPPEGFYENLVGSLLPDELSEAKQYVLESAEIDKTSRKDWADAYTKGLDLLGLKIEERTEPFKGATGVYHPMLMEAIGQFQAGAYKELIPSNGPVNTKIIGKPSPELDKKAQRVKDYMNYKLMFEMEEFEPEFDQMLFYVALAGSTFKKVYKDPDLGRTVSMFIPAENMLVPYTASSLRSAERVTQMVPMSRNKLKKLQEVGFYAESKLPTTTVTISEIKEKYDELEGRTPAYSGTKDDSTYTVLECHCNFRFESLGDSEDSVSSPYIITVVEETSEIIGVRRNWEEVDPRKKRKEFFVHYKFTPGLGFFGFGLIHLLGNLSTSATSNLRQLIDAGTLSNLPGGFKTRGLRVANDQEPIAPGEWRDVDVPGNNLRESLVPLPYKEPSGTLFQLLGFVVQAGEKFVGTQELGIADGNKETPVGTTVALLERGTKIMSAVHKRLHGALKVELKLLAASFALDVDAYPYEVDGAAPEVFKDDFSPKVDVQPVSDPNIFSMAQRVILAQEQLKMAQSAPELHDLYEAFKRMYSALGVQNVDDILKPPAQPMPENPAIENGRMPILASGAPAPALKAFPSQDHDAHIAAHMAFAQSRVVKQAPAVYAVLLAHIYDHVALKCEAQAREQLGMPAPKDPTKEAPMDELSMDPKLQQLTAQLIAKFLVQFAKYEDQFLGSLQDGEDPIVALKNRELDITEQKNHMNAQEAEAKREQALKQELLRIQTTREENAKKIAAQKEIADKKIKSTEELSTMKASVDLTKSFTTPKNNKPN